MSNNPIKPKDRVKIPRQGMPEQDPAERARNFEEVPLGYSEETAQLERAFVPLIEPLAFVEQIQIVLFVHFGTAFVPFFPKFTASSQICYGINPS